MKKVYIIGVGGIGVSAIARYYNENGWRVFGSDKTGSKLVEKLKNEGIDIIIGEDEKRISSDLDLVVYTEAVAETQKELKKSKDLGLTILTYPQALANISNSKKQIAVSGSHGKSTTSSLISVIFKNSKFGVNSVIGTLLKEFNGKNSFFSDSEYFVIEACEYKRSFLNYKPFVGVITNIDLDHLDYYKDLEDYESAFENFVLNIKKGGYLILNGDCKSSMKFFQIRKDINYIIISKDFYSFTKINSDKKEKYLFPKLELQVPGEHFLFDARIAFSVASILGIDENIIISSLEGFSSSWRRSEIVGTTKNGNILMSDYGHHPTEIKPTLKALKEKYLDKKLYVIFQPHQYARTLTLFDQFKDCFSSADILVIPNIYESRDSEEDKQKINTEKLLKNINHSQKFNGNGLENTLKEILKYDENNPNSTLFLLLGAGDVDNLRYKIEIIV